MIIMEIILTYASSSEGAFPSFDSGIVPSSSANTVEVTVTDSHRFPFRKNAKAIKGNHKTHNIYFSNCSFILSLQKEPRKSFFAILKFGNVLRHFLAFNHRYHIAKGFKLIGSVSSGKNKFRAWGFKGDKFFYILY